MHTHKNTYISYNKSVYLIVVSLDVCRVRVVVCRASVWGHDPKITQGRDKSFIKDRFQEAPPSMM